MTRRERMERRLEKRQEWAAGRAAKAEAGFTGARRALDGIEPGQPILVGHHSEKRHRGALERHDARMRAACESADMAKHHAAKADGLAHQLDRSIFSDDPDAIEALEAKAAAIEAECETMKRANKAFKAAARGSSDPVRAGLLAVEAECGADIARKAADTLRYQPYYNVPFPPYALSNARGNARRCRERIKSVRARQTATNAAAETPNGVKVNRHAEADFCCATFAEKPAREVLDALKGAGFWWSNGSWVGKTSALPACVAEFKRAERKGGRQCLGPTCCASAVGVASGSPKVDVPEFCPCWAGSTSGRTAACRAPRKETIN